MIRVELFRTFLLPCPRCGCDVLYRANQEHPSLPQAPAIRCGLCSERIDRMHILAKRIRHEAVEGLSWDCESCGQWNFILGVPAVCDHCGQPVV